MDHPQTFLVRKMAHYKIMKSDLEPKEDAIMTNGEMS